jgi:zinc transport system permease protein
MVAGLLARLACGVVGTYVVVRRMASLSGGIAHAAFAGVGLGYLVGFDPLLGAAGFALLAGLGLSALSKRVQAAPDTLVAALWSLGMALGILFVSLTPGYAPDLMSYLFGSILLVKPLHVGFLGILDGAILLGTLLFFRELRAVTFDEEFSRLMGLPVDSLRNGLLAMVSLAVVVLIRVVGVILVLALLTIPATVARQWTDRLPTMMLLASLLGAACTVTGLFLSYELSTRWNLNVPTGPLVVLLAAGLFGVSTAVRRFRAHPG